MSSHHMFRFLQTTVQSYTKKTLGLLNSINGVHIGRGITTLPPTAKSAPRTVLPFIHSINSNGKNLTTLFPTKRCHRAPRSQVSNFPSVLFHRAYSSTSQQNPSHIKSIREGEMGSIEVEWHDGTKKEFLHFWLRDHCRCSTCFHPDTFQRQIDTLQIPLDVKPLNVKIEGDSIRLMWKDPNGAHESLFNSEFLRSVGATSFTAATRPKVLWGKEILNNLPQLTYEEAHTVAGMKKWMDLIDSYGFAFVNGVPLAPKYTKALLERIGCIRETLYGGFWDFQPNLAMADTAYTNLGLNTHTDGCYFYDPPGLQCFHLIEFDGVGGQTTLVDSFKVLSDLKEKHKEAYSFLSTVPVTFQYKDNDHFLSQKRPVILLDENGELLRFNLNNDDRAASDMSPQEQRGFYKSLHVLLKLLRDPMYEIQLQLTAGKVLAIDNWRVLHGRRAFTGHRRMLGAYLSREDYESRRIMADLQYKQSLQKSENQQTQPLQQNQHTKSTTSIPLNMFGSSSVSQENNTPASCKIHSNSLTD